MLPFQGGHHLSHRMHAATHGILPRKVGGDSAYDAHCNAYGRAHAHRQEYKRRKSHFEANSAFINEHNSAAAASYILGMNHFGDWSDQEFSSIKQVITFSLQFYHCNAQQLYLTIQAFGVMRSFPASSR